MQIIGSNVLLKVNQSQKDEAIIGGQKFSTGKRYNENFRERNPVLAYVEQGYGEVKTGMWIVCNYTMFDWTSPFFIGDDLYVIPVNEEIFAWVDESGNLHPLGGNILMERIEQESAFKLPDDYKKKYFDRGFVLSDGYGYSKGDYVLWTKMADYGIVYNWNGVEKEVVKVHNKEIVGIIRK